MKTIGSYPRNLIQSSYPPGAFHPVKKTRYNNLTVPQYAVETVGVK